MTALRNSLLSIQSLLYKKLKEIENEQSWVAQRNLHKLNSFPRKKKWNSLVDLRKCDAKKKIEFWLLTLNLPIY